MRSVLKMFKVLKKFKMADVRPFFFFSENFFFLRLIICGVKLGLMIFVLPLRMIHWMLL